MTHDLDHSRPEEQVRSFFQSADDCRLECLFWLVGLTGVITILVLIVVDR